MNIQYELIAKYIRNECSSGEIQIVEEWINASEKNKQTFFNLKIEWKHLKDSSPEIIPDKEEMWSLISRKLDSTSGSYSISGSRRTKIIIASIAASVAIILGIGGTALYRQFFYNHALEASLTEFRCPSGHKAQALLPDGTSVWINSMSGLKYDTEFNLKKRNVEINGEAFFDVAKDTGKKFIVNVSEIDIEALGTSFNVSAYEDDPEIKISLLSGSISLSTHHSGEKIGHLLPNQMAIIDKKSKRCRIIPDDAALTGLWTQNILRIYDEDILMVAKKLERWYGVNINIKNPNMKPRYSFVVKTESLRELLQLLNKITPIENIIEGEEVYITYK